MRILVRCRVALRQQGSQERSSGKMEQDGYDLVFRKLAAGFKGFHWRTQHLLVQIGWSIAFDKKDRLGSTKLSDCAGLVLWQ